MAFKNELSLRSSVLVVSKNPSSPSNHLFQVDIADNLFQSSFALRFQGIKIPSFPRRSVGNKVGLRVDTQWSERAPSVELGDEDTCLRKVEKPSCVSGRPLPFAKSLNRMQGGA